jgi:hypothetical protein
MDISALHIQWGCDVLTKYDFQLEQGHSNSTAHH